MTHDGVQNLVGLGLPRPAQFPAHVAVIPAVCGQTRALNGVCAITIPDQES